MNVQNESLQELKHIKKMMERSTKFSSLSGFSGIAAGICALAGIWFVRRIIINEYLHEPLDELAVRLLLIAVATFIAAAISSSLFIYLRCKRLGIPVLGLSSGRVIINLAIPLSAGSLFIFRLASIGLYELIPPACLIFYGLALVNASKYTLSEVRYLGFAELITGIINLWVLKYGLIFWGTGFGLIHIIYGVIFWWKYEKKDLKISKRHK